MHFLIDIAFNEPQIVQCKPIAALLMEMSNNVLDMIAGLSKGGLLR